MSTSSFDHPLDDIAAYAVGALEPDEAGALEAHLATCAACQAELAAHREALAHLVVDEEPPPGLWGRIVATLPDAPAAADGASEPGALPGEPAALPAEPGGPPVPGRIEIRPRALRTPEAPDGAPAGGTPPLRPVPPPPPEAPSPAPYGDGRGGSGSGAGDGGTGGRAGPLHLAGRPRRQRLARAVAAVAAAVVLVAASVGATLAITGGDDEEGGDEPPAVAAPSAAQLAQAAADDPTSVAQLASEAGQPQARLVTSDDGSFVLFDALPTLPLGRAYQLWSLDSGTPVSLGVLGDGSAEAVAVAVPPSTVQVAISDAPEAGEPQPTGPIVATGQVKAA